MNPSSPPPSSESPPGAEILFYEALEKAPEARDSFLDHACGQDPALRQTVEALLADHQRAQGFLSEEAAAGRHANADNVEPVTEKPGFFIGPYKLLEQIGEGGFGTVWVAEQERPVRRRVALKVIKLGMDTKEVLARFEQERQALALMDHPNIARMFDAGTTPLGRPYFVMELVRGVKITEYCDTARLTTEQRLRLMIQVCHAVQHAHQKGVIHRDLKPSNILITLHDGVPVPKVIDFGVAKATRDQRLTDATVYTQFQQMIGTPAYMAPEQAEMSGLDVDTRSDIYSLGVLLYELLTGKPPFEHERLLRAGCDEMRRVLREEDPQKPSTFVSTMAVELRTDMARSRSEEGGRLISLIRGDLDCIAMKALEKDRARRYDTASSLAEDISRHLESEPVHARPPSAGYLFRRFARRNKVALISSAAVLAALFSGLGAATWMYIKEKDARQRATAAEQAQSAERQKAEQVARFLRDMLEGVKPQVAIGRDTRLLTDIVDRAAIHATTELGNQPAIEAQVSLIIGEVYNSLGNSSKALQHVARSLELTEKLHGKDHLEYAEVLQAYGACHEGEDAVRLCRDALALKIKHLGENHVGVATSRTLLASSVRNLGGYAEAEELARHAVETLKRELDPVDRRLSYPLMILAQAVGWQGRAPEAERLNRESLLILRAHYGDNHPDVAIQLLNLGQGLRDQKRFEEAERAFRDSLQIGQRVLPVDHQIMELLRWELSKLLASIGRPEAAQAVNYDTIQEIKQPPGEQNSFVLAERLSVLKEMVDRGSTSAIERLAREIIQMSSAQAQLNQVSQNQLTSYLINLSSVLRQRGEPEAAAKILVEIQTFLRKRQTLGGRRWDDFQPDLAENLFRLGRYAEAEPHFREWQERTVRSSQPKHTDVLRATSGLGLVLAEWAWQDSRSGADEVAGVTTSLDRAREAETLLRDCLKRWQSQADPQPWRMADDHSRLGRAILVATIVDRSLSAEGRELRMVEAERYLLDGYKGVEADPNDGSSKYLHDAVERLTRLYTSWNKPTEAESWQKKLNMIHSP